MGNVCCEQQPTPIANPIISTVTERPQQCQPNPRSQKQLLFEQQKALLIDFSRSLSYLYKYGRYDFIPELECRKYRIGKLISSDGVAQYFKGSSALIGDYGQQEPEQECIIKKIDKRKLVTKNQKKALIIEYSVTRYLITRFIVNCFDSYQDQNFLYLFFVLGSYQPLNAYTTANVNSQYYAKFRLDLQASIRFLVAGIILGLQQLHKMGLVYRGINNQNIIITSSGYPQLINLSKLHPEGYKNPQPVQSNHFTSWEQFRGKPLTAVTDFWDIGVLVYYICKGSYLNFSVFKENQFQCQGLSQSLVDFVNKLLILSPANRLGAGGINELKNHSFFSDFDWNAYNQNYMVSPLRFEANNNLENEERTPFNFSCCSQKNQASVLMGDLFFIEINTIYKIYQAICNEEASTKHARQKSQQDQNQEEQFHMTTQIDIRDENIGKHQTLRGDYD